MKFQLWILQLCWTLSLCNIILMYNYTLCLSSSSKNFKCNYNSIWKHFHRTVRVLVLLSWLSETREVTEKTWRQRVVARWKIKCFAHVDMSIVDNIWVDFCKTCVCVCPQSFYNLKLVCDMLAFERHCRTAK